jgi:hypothetical protein
MYQAGHPYELAHASAWITLPVGDLSMQVLLQTLQYFEVIDALGPGVCIRPHNNPMVESKLLNSDKKINLTEGS